MKLDESVGFVINQTGRKLSQLLSAAFSPFDITPEQWTLLNRLSENDGISQKDLALRVEKDQTNVTRILDQLERKGFIQRRPNVNDRRSFLAYITEEGKKLNEKLIPIEDEVLRLACTNLTKQDVDTLKGILLEISRNVDLHFRTER